MARVEEVKYPICIHSDRSVSCGDRNITVIFQPPNQVVLNSAGQGFVPRADDCGDLPQF